MCDTIAAVATPVGVGAIGIVRVSGADALAVLRRAFRRADDGADYVSHMMYYGRVVDRGSVIDEAMAVYFAAPRSYTTEDSAEIYCHGGAVAVRRTLDAALHAGARAAEPGEFTRRAYENGRIDLTQAEAALALIEAKSEAAAKAALFALEGGASRFIAAAKRSLTRMLAMIDAAIDFPDEVDETLTRGELTAGIDALLRSLDAASDETLRRRVLDGVTVALVGAPNVGKSSLLNRVVNEERALVHDAPGTTRDVVEARLEVEGVTVTVCDTAGLREPMDAVERMGIDRALAAIERADAVFAVLDATRGVTEGELAYIERVDAQKLRVIVNKADLPNGSENSILKDKLPPVPIFYTSAATGEGVDAVIAEIRRAAGAVDCGERLLQNGRQAALARRAGELLREARTNLEGGDPIDPLSTDLAAALAVLSELDGSDAREAVVDDIFRSFCVGK